MRSRVIVVSAVIAAALLAGAIWHLTRPQPAGTLLTSRLDAPRIPGPCDGGAKTGFVPTSVDIQDVAKGLQVLALPRDAYDTPSTPPETQAGKFAVAWDAPGNKPGGKYGNVLLNTHTWPDGSALGNALLDKMHQGSLLTLRRGDTKLCYRVTREVQVPASADYPDFWIDDGPPQMAIIVCSGQRLGPGNWSHLTIWFGVPFYGADSGGGSNAAENTVHITS